MATSLSLYPLGVGDFGASRLFHISLLLEVDGRPIAIDCPHRFAEMLAFNRVHGMRQVELAQYQEIFLTHLHIDHAGGLAEMVAAGLLAVEEPIKLHAPEQTLAYLWSEHQERGVISAAQIKGGQAALSRYFKPIALQNPHSFDDFTLHYRATDHFPNTFAYIFDFGNYKLGYSADTPFDLELIAWLDQCDLVLHDVTWPPWWDDIEMPKLHAPLARLLELPLAFQQKTLLCHYDESNYREQNIGGYRFLEQNQLYQLVG